MNTFQAIQIRISAIMIAPISISGRYPERKNSGPVVNGIRIRSHFRDARSARGNTRIPVANPDARPVSKRK